MFMSIFFPIIYPNQKRVQAIKEKGRKKIKNWSLTVSWEASLPTHLARKKTGRSSATGTSCFSCLLTLSSGQKSATGISCFSCLLTLSSWRKSAAGWSRSQTLASNMIWIGSVKKHWLRIREILVRIWILLFSSVTFQTATKNNFFFFLFDDRRIRIRTSY